MNKIIEKYDENAIYDTNRINLAIKNQFISNLNFSSNNTEFIEVESGELMKVLTSDSDFIQNYTSIKRKENINSEFTDLPQQKKFDLLIKNFFYLKTEKENIFYEYMNTKKELDEQLRKQEIIINEKLEKYKQESYKLKCSYEELNSKYYLINEKNKELMIKNEEILTKFERLKEKNNEKENLYIKITLEKNLIESRFEKFSKQASEDNNNIKSLLEKEKKEKENLARDLEVLFRKNEEFKIKYEELILQNTELLERNRKLEILSKIDRKSLQDYGTIQNCEGMPLDQIYMTSNSININDLKDDKKGLEENYTVQMEVNIAKINKNSTNVKYNINQSIMNKEELDKCIVPDFSKKDTDNLSNPKPSKENFQNKTSTYIANLLEDHNNVIQILNYSENEIFEIQQTENSIYSQENDGDHNSNNYSSGIIMYETVNYDTLRNFKPRFDNPCETEENAFNSIKGENYSSSVSGISKK